MCLQDLQLSEVPLRTEDRHDPGRGLTEFVHWRDGYDDGPTGAGVRADRADLDHDTPFPHGPTAAWNLAARGRRTHLLKHRGWTPIRTETATWWTSPAGQIVQMPHHDTAPPGIDTDTDGVQAGGVPDPEALAELDQILTRTEHDLPPWDEPPF